MGSCFPFTDLPREIRNAIYLETLTRPDGALFIGTHYSQKLNRGQAVIVNSPGRISSSLRDNPSQRPASAPGLNLNLALLRSNKTVHAEAVGVLYGQKLTFVNLVALQSFLANLAPAQIDHLRHISLLAENDSSSPDAADQRAFMPSVFAMLAGADSLETLCVPEMSLARAICFPNRVDKMQTLEKTIDVAARDVAREVYGCLFTFLRRAVAARGIDKVTEMMDVFGDVSVVHNPDRVRAPVQTRHIVGIQWTEERITALKKALGEEIERLLKEDVNR